MNNFSITNQIRIGSLLTVLLISGCGGSSNSPEVIGDVDTTPPVAPTIISQSTETLTPTITGTFDSSDSEGGLVVTVNGISYSLTEDDALTNDGDTWQLIIPNNNELPLGNYDITVVSTDASGNSATDNTTDDLTIADLTAPAIPTVVRQTVENMTPTISGTFDESDREGGFVVTVNNINYTLVTGGPLTNNGDSWKLMIPKNSALAYGSYDVTVVATDGAGNSSTDLSYNELTITDLTAPAVVRVSPSNNSTTIALGTTLDARFDEDMAPASIDSRSFLLSSNSAISGSISYSQNDKTATFTPHSSLSLATSYTATLTRRIKDLYNNEIASNYSWSFTTKDGTWSAPLTISNDNDESTAYPRVIFDNAGNAVSVWRQSDGGRYDIWSNSYSPSDGWGAPQLVESDDTGDARDVEIAKNDAGTIIAVWAQNDGSNYNIWASFYAHDSGWTTPALIENISTGNANYPNAVIDNNGNVTVVWQQHDGTRNSIWANRYLVGTGWQTPEVIETIGDENSYYAKADVDNDGNVIVVWQKDSGAASGEDIWSNRYSINDDWGTAELLENSDSGVAKYPQVGFDASGNAIAIWEQKASSKEDVWVSHYIKGVGWQPRVELDTNDTYNAREPKLAVADNGDAIAIWQEEPNGIEHSIFVSHYTNGENWSAPILIENYTTGKGDYPEIAIDKHGNAIATWQQQIGDNVKHVAVNRYTVAGGWGTAQLIEANAIDNISYPRIAFGPLGNAIITWYQDDGVNTNIWLAHFE